MKKFHKNGKRQSNIEKDKVIQKIEGKESSPPSCKK